MEQSEELYLLELSKELLKKTEEALKNGSREVVVFINRKLSMEAKAFLSNYGITVRLSKKTYNDCGLDYEYWTYAIVMV